MYILKNSIDLLEIAWYRSCHCEKDHNYFYKALKMRILEKSNEFLEIVINEHLNGQEQEIIVKRFGLEDDMNISTNELANKLNLEENDVLKIISDCLKTIAYYTNDICEIVFSKNKISNVFEALIKECGIDKFIEICLEKEKKIKLFEFDFGIKLSVKEKLAEKRVLASPISSLGLPLRVYNILHTKNNLCNVLDLIKFISSGKLKTTKGIGEKFYVQITERISRVLPDFEKRDFSNTNIQNFNIRNGIYDKTLNSIDIEILFRWSDFDEDADELINVLKENKIFTIADVLDFYNKEFDGIENLKRYQKRQLKKCLGKYFGWIYFEF